jgi:hypothetical protein
MDQRAHLIHPQKNWKVLAKFKLELQRLKDVLNEMKVMTPRQHFKLAHCQRLKC